MLRPPISISPTKMRPVSTTKHSVARTSSANGRSHFDPSESARIQKVIINSQPSPKPEDALVANLRQQVQCLEMEVKYLKSSGAPTAPKGDLLSVTSAGRGNNLNTTVGSIAETRRGENELLRRADELEHEVNDLKQKYAIREQAHQLELAELRRMIDSDSKSRGAHLSLREEMQRREEQLKNDLGNLKALQAQEIVALQRTVERLQLEQQNSQSTIAFLAQEKDAAAKEIVTLRDELRSKLYRTENAEKQQQQVMIHLETELGIRRSLEQKEASLREELEEVKKKNVSCEASLMEAQQQSRRFEAEAQTRAYENDQLKLTVAKQQQDLSKAASDVIESKNKTKETTDKFAELNEKLAKAVQGITDIQSEKEYFRLQTDRLKVENSLLEVKASQFEQALNAERTSLVTVERQLCAALEQADQLRRDARSKEDIYRGIDNFGGHVRVELRLAQETSDALRRQLDEMRKELQASQAQYDAVKHLVDQQRTEQQVQSAILQLAKTKAEMQQILSHQQRVASEFNNAMIDLPEVVHLSRVASPHRSSMSVPQLANDISVVEAAEPPGAVDVPPVAPISTMQTEVKATTTMTPEEIQQAIKESTLRLQQQQEIGDALI